MNKIFRVIYSQATQSWVAVSELTKAHKKQSSSNAQKNAVNISGSVFKSSVIALGLLTGANAAYAVNTAGQGQGTAVAWGSNSSADSATSVAIGNNSRANNPDGIAIGAGAYNDRVGADGAIAIGKSAHNSQKESIAIGVSANNVGNNSIAIGNTAQTQNGSEAIAIGSNTVAKQQSVVLGNNATAVSKAIAIGYTASVSSEGGIAQGYGASSTNTDAIALGTGAKSGGGGSVALGQKADAMGNHSLAIGPLAKASAAKGDAIAIGFNSEAKAYRSVAIANESVAEGENAVSIGWYAKAIGTESAALGDHAQAKAEHSMAIGSNSNAREENAIALGTQADAAKRNALSLGTSSHAGQDAVAAGYKADAADRSVAIGSESASLNEADIAIGKGAKAIGKQGAIAAGLGTRAVGHSSIMIGGSDISDAASQTVKYDEEDHTKVTDAIVDELINGAKVKRHYKVIDTAHKTDTLATAYKALTGKKMNTTTLDYSDSKNQNGHSSISLGIHALSTGHLGTAIGTGARADSLGSIALGAGAVADRQNAVAIGTGSTTELQGSRQTDVSYNAAGAIVSSDSPDVAYTFKWAGGINTSAGDVVSFGSAGAERQLKNVAAGRVAEDSTDAINGSQLNSVARKVASGWQVAGDDKTKVSGIGSDDQVNFINGSGTTVSVTAQDVVKETVTENGKQVEKIKTPKGANVKFDVKAADTSLEVGANGVKVKASDGIKTTTDGIKVNTGKGLKIDTADGNKVAVDTDGTTITVDNKGKVKAVTGSIETVTDTNKGTGEKVGQVRPVETDKGKLATVDAVASAVNNAAWSITSDTDGGSFATSGHTQTTEKISAGGSVTFKAGNNLIIKQVGTDFTYSLNPILSGLTSAEFKGTGENAPITKLTNAGITVTKPADAVANTPEKTVTLNQDGLNNGGNAISNVKSNLPATKNSDTANTAAAPSNATKTQAVPNTTNMKGTDYVNPNNAATVGDVLNAGWNLKGKGTAVDFVKAYDTVDFVDGDGTTASVESKDGQTSTVKYSVNTTTITADTANAGKVKAEGTGNTFATAETVASAINDAYWKAAASGNGATTDVADNVKAGDTVTFKAGKNLTVTHNNTNKSFEFATTDTPEFSSVQFGNNGPKITNDGNTIKVSGANGTDSVKITNVANGSDGNDAVNVNQLKASGWKIAGNNKTEVDTINPSDQVNFLDGSGTTVTVEKDKGADGKENGNVNVKYDVNVGNGLQKDTASNTISVKPADSTITVGTDGVKVNTGDIATESTGKATTALDKAIAEATKELDEATKAGDATAQQAAQTKLEAANKAKADAGKQIATVENVTEAINKAGWNAIAAKTENGEVSGEAAQLVKPGETVTFEADKNIKIAQNGSKFTFSTKDNVEFTTVKVGKDDAATGKKPVSLTTQAATTADNNQTAPTTALNISSGTGTDAKPTQITGVGSVLNTNAVPTIPAGTATDAAQQPKLVNLGTAHGQTTLDNKVLNAAATVRDLANMGWVVSSNKITDGTGEYKDVVKNANEVKFVGKNAAKVSGKTENGVRTITVDVEVPDVKTVKLVSSTDGSVIAPSTDSKLQDALKAAKDELAALPKNATDEQKKEAEKKVKDAETALNNALDEKGVATAKNVADMINNSGFTLKTSATAGGKKDDASAGDEVINPGKTVEMVAGKNLTVKQDADGKVTYSLNPELISLTSAEFKADGKPTTKISSDGITITPAAPTTGGEQKPNVSLTENGLNNGGNSITNVAGNLDGAKTGTTAPTDSATKPTALTETNAATVGDVLNSGWNIQEKGAAKDFVKAYDTVNFDEGNGTSVSVGVSKDGKISTVKYSVKAADKSLEVGANGVNVKVSDGIETTTNGIAVKAADKTLTVGKDGVKVNTGAIAAANGGDDQTINRGKVTVTPKTKADGTTETQAEAETRAASEIATVKNVADAINSAAWIAKVENTDDSVDTPTENDKGTAVKAGDTLNLKAGKNLKAKRDGQNITFALAKDITVETANVENTLSIGKDGAKVNIAPTANGLSFSRPAATAGGAKQPVTLSGISSGLDKFDATDPKTEGLLNLNKTEAGKTEPAVGDNTAATVGDLRGMGWVLSADKKTDNPAEAYNAQVKNAEEVKFVGASGVIVSGKTDGNVRTITVGVDHQLATNNSVKPVEYTKKDGTKVYPKTVTKNDGTTETKFYPNADGTGDEVPAGDVIVSVNGANGTTSPTTLSNVKSNLPETRNVAVAGDETNKPKTTSQAAPKTTGTGSDVVKTDNAATVGDVLNSGWNLKGNGSAVDFVRAYDTVNFVNGKGTTVSIETDGAESRVKVDVDTADLTASNGKINAPDLKTLEDAVKTAKADADANPTDEAKKTALAKAEADLAKEQNKGVTAQNVAKAINESGFTLKTSATTAADNLTADNTLKNNGEVINPGKTVEMVAGKNLTVKQDADGRVTYATKDDVEFATVKIGKDEDGKKTVSLTTEKAVKASNNETGKEPATALKISSDGKPAQLVGVASVLNTSEVTTKPDGDKKADGTPAESKTEKLIDLAGTDTAPVNKNAAATVGDLQNMGWVVSTKDGNGYTDVVKNADKVDFKGGNGIEVTGTTTDAGVREITVSIKEGEVTNHVTITKADGKKVDAVKIGDTLYERDKDGKPKRDASNNLITVTPAAGDTVENKGSGFVTGNTVANAVNESGWNVGLAEKANADAAFGDSKYALDAGKPEKVNPDDNVYFANGNNTVVKAATVEEVDKDGKTVTNTYIRVDAELPISQISAVDENGNKVVKDADGNWYLSKADGTADKTQPKVDPAKVRQSASMDPENKGDRYTPLAKRSDDAALTADQKDALSKQQDQYAKDAADKIAEQLKGQPQTVIEAAQKAAAEVARVEAKDKYLKDNGLDKGIGGTVITNVAWGQKPDDAVNVDQLQNSGWNLDSKAVAGSSGKVISGNVSPSKVKMDETVNIDAGNNIEITRNGKNIGIATSMTPQFSSVSLGAGADAPTLSVDDEGALNVGSKDANKPVRITNVAPGVKEGDVTNVAQLKGVAQNLNNRIDNVDGNARAGIAQAIATAGLVQAYLPGKSMMAIGGGTYRGEAGYAIGYSSISDGGNWIIKGTASGNSRGHFGASASVGYQW